MFRKAFATLATSAVLLSAPLSANAADIVDTAIEAGSFETLVAAVGAAGLVDTLKSEGPFTVFAPSDEAFAALPEGTVESLLEPENKDKLVEILTLHVVPAKVMSSEIVDQTVTARTVNGEKLLIDGRKGVKVNDAKVISADIETDNGVIHVIDKVILPES
ncbi:MAG: fasciclin domain-containing protein [Mangrovicoccus sp.]|nr:fasciclin domain-containing protein [Mangrovicoccus sp.]